MTFVQLCVRLWSVTVDADVVGGVGARLGLHSKDCRGGSAHVCVDLVGHRGTSEVEQVNQVSFNQGLTIQALVSVSIPGVDQSCCFEI